MGQNGFMLDTRIDLTFSDDEEIVLSGAEHKDFTAVRIGIGRDELAFFVKDAASGEALLAAIEAATTMKVIRTAVVKV